MTATVDAIYESCSLRLVRALSLPEHTRVRIQLETIPSDPERAAWLEHSEQGLKRVWENDADDVYNDLLAPNSRQS